MRSEATDSYTSQVMGPNHATISGLGLRDLGPSSGVFIFLTIIEAFLIVSKELFSCHCTGNSVLSYYFCLSCPPFYNSRLTALPSTSWMLLNISGDSKCMGLHLDFYENASCKV